MTREKEKKRNIGIGKNGIRKMDTGRNEFVVKPTDERMGSGKQDYRGKRDERHAKSSRDSEKLNKFDNKISPGKGQRSGRADNLSGKNKDLYPDKSGSVKGKDVHKEQVRMGKHKNHGESRNGTGKNTGQYKGRGVKVTSKCPVFKECGGCQMLDMPYQEQLNKKQMELEGLLKKYATVHPIIGMKNPYYYRNKVHAVFDHDRRGNAFSGVYKANTHIVVPVESCMIEDQKADEIIGTIRGLLKSFKIRTYDEDTGYGLLRHVLVRRGFSTGEIMVVLVTASPVLPSKNNFVKVLLEKHPEITTIIQNVNNRGTSIILGEKEKNLYGKGYIEDILCGYVFRISSKSFYQVNPVQTEILYRKAIEAAGLTGTETVIDAYCGIGTIGIVASKYAAQVIGVELNQSAVRDAVENAKRNGISNVHFFCNDAGAFMVNMAEQGERADVVFMDPPRSGSTEEFIDSVAKLKVGKVVYVSCNPVTLERDLGDFEKKGYRAEGVWGMDLFPHTAHVETVVLLERKGQ